MVAQPLTQLAPKDRLETVAKRCEDELSRLDSVNASTCPSDLADLAEYRSSAEMAERRRVGLMTRLRQIAAARQRLDEGTWGQCEHCGQPIEPARLEVLPTTARCAGHA